MQLGPFLVLADAVCAARHKAAVIALASSGVSCSSVPCWLQAYSAILRSPDEFETTPAVAELMQNYFLKLLSRYREFVEPDYLQGTSNGPHRHRESATGHSIDGTPDDSSYLKWASCSAAGHQS